MAQAKIEQPTNSKVKDFTSTNGNKYVLQKVSFSKWLDILDESESSGRRKRTYFYPAVLENVVVSPSIKVDDFEEAPYGGFAELDEVVAEAIRFQQS